MATNGGAMSRKRSIAELEGALTLPDGRKKRAALMALSIELAARVDCVGEIKTQSGRVQSNGTDDYVNLVLVLDSAVDFKVAVLPKCGKDDHVNKDSIVWQDAHLNAGDELEIKYFFDKDAEEPLFETGVRYKLHKCAIRRSKSGSFFTQLFIQERENGSALVLV